MPIYDYVCSACGHRLEVVHGIHGHGPLACPACEAEGTMRKAFVPPAIHFKGSGWAKKDRSATSSPGTTTRSKPDASPATSTGSSTEAGAATPPAAGSTASGTSPASGTSTAVGAAGD